MDFGLSEDQLLLEKTLRSFLAEEVSISRVRDLRDADCPNDVGIWRSLAELGVTGMLIPETQGGSDLSLLDAALVAQSLGHAVTPTPFVGSAVMAPIAFRALAGNETAGWLQGIAAGEIRFGVAAQIPVDQTEVAGDRA